MTAASGALEDHCGPTHIEVMFLAHTHKKEYYFLNTPLEEFRTSASLHAIIRQYIYTRSPVDEIAL